MQSQTHHLPQHTRGAPDRGDSFFNSLAANAAGSGRVLRARMRCRAVVILAQTAHSRSGPMGDPGHSSHLWVDLFTEQQSSRSTPTHNEQQRQQPGPTQGRCRPRVRQQHQQGLHRRRMAKGESGIPTSCWLWLGMACGWHSTLVPAKFSLKLSLSPGATRRTRIGPIILQT